MAFKTFYFPAQSGHYSTKFGNLQFKIYYSNSTDENLDVNVDLMKMGELSIPLLITPASDEFRFSEININFRNNSDLFESNPIFLKEKEKETFIDIIKDGALFWRGVLNFDAIKKNEWFLDSGSLKYKKIEASFYDALYYFRLNPKDLLDASWVNDISVKSMLENIASLINFNASDVYIDPALNFTEPCGTVYDLNDFLINDWDSSFNKNMDVLVFLKQLMLSFAVYIFIHNGKFYVLKRNGGTIYTVNHSSILKIAKEENANPIKYIEFKSTRNWDSIMGTGYGDREDKFSSGDASRDNDYKFIHDSELLKYIRTVGSGSSIPETEIDNDGSTNMIRAENIDVMTAGIETGDRVVYNKEAGLPGDSASVVTDLDYEKSAAAEYSYIYFYPDDPTISGELFYIDALAIRFKQILIVPVVGNDYKEIYLKSGDHLHLTFKKISDFLDFSRRFSIASKNYKLISCKLNFVNDQIRVVLIEVE